MHCAVVLPRIANILSILCTIPVGGFHHIQAQDWDHAGSLPAGVLCAHSVPGADHPSGSYYSFPLFSASNASALFGGDNLISGNHRALIIYVRFADDTHDSAHGIWPQWRSMDSFPAFGDYFLEPASPDGNAPGPPFSEYSLTDYFHRQSNRQWLLYGEAYPEVITTDLPENVYEITGVRTAGLRRLTIEILDKIDAEGWDFSRYDADGDGRVDHVFIVVRRINSVNWGGYSLLGSGQDLVYDGVRVSMHDSGSYIRANFGGNSMPPLTMGRLMAHEYGHDLWGSFFNHLSGIPSNDVPSNHTQFLGYTLMAGGNYIPGEGEVNTDKAGNETISAFERALIGWIDCFTLSESRNNIVVRDLYSTGDCFQFDLAGDGEVYVSNLQRSNYFDQLYAFPSSVVPHEDGLMSTGLLVGLRIGTQYDELPADNTIEIGIWSSIYEGDLYSPRTEVQITPWTRPSINGRTLYPTASEVSWQAIDNIRRGSGTSLRFDYVADFRTRPVIRKDSWMGTETSEHMFETDLRVMPGAVLTIQSGTTIFLADDVNIIVESGGRLNVESGARIEFGRNSQIIYRGTEP